MTYAIRLNTGFYGHTSKALARAKLFPTRAKAEAAIEKNGLEGKVVVVYMHVGYDPRPIVETNISDMVGHTFDKVIVSDRGLVFIAHQLAYIFRHEQECCEDVHVSDIEGDVEDLTGSVLLKAEEVCRMADISELGKEASMTWTFYRFATVKGYVTVTFRGTSNGYYSEKVNILRYEEYATDSDFEKRVMSKL